jgi:hypothetical protein
LGCGEEREGGRESEKRREGGREGEREDREGDLARPSTSLACTASSTTIRERRNWLIHLYFSRSEFTAALTLIEEALRACVYHKTARYFLARLPQGSPLPEVRLQEEEVHACEWLPFAEGVERLTCADERLALQRLLQKLQ